MRGVDVGRLVVFFFGYIVILYILVFFVKFLGLCEWVLVKGMRRSYVLVWVWL